MFRFSCVHHCLFRFSCVLSLSLCARRMCCDALGARVRVVNRGLVFFLSLRSSESSQAVRRKFSRHQLHGSGDALARGRALRCRGGALALWPRPFPRLPPTPRRRRTRRPPQGSDDLSGSESPEEWPSGRWWAEAPRRTRDRPPGGPTAGRAGVNADVGVVRRSATRVQECMCFGICAVLVFRTTKPRQA